MYHLNSAGKLLWIEVLENMRNMLYEWLFRSAYVGMKIGLNVMFVYIWMDALSVCECLI